MPSNSPSKLNNSSGSSSPCSSPEKPISTAYIESRRPTRMTRTSSPFTMTTATSGSPSSREKALTNDERTRKTSNAKEYGVECGDIQQSPIALDSSDRASPAPFRNKQPTPPKTSGSYLWMIVAGMIVVVAILFTLSSNKSEVSINDKSPIVKIDCSKLTALVNRFPNQDQKLFKSLKVGIEGTVNEKPPELAVFSLFSTDENLIENVLQEVVKIAKQCLKQTEDPLVLDNAHLGSKMVEMYSEELAKRNIMIISNLEKASPADVKHLHAFCDTYNPLVGQSVIFLTIRVPQTPKGKPVEYITEYLNELWKSLADNIRNPLITRMVDQTFFLKPSSM